MDLGKNFLKETLNIVEKDKEDQDENSKMIADELEAMFAGTKNGGEKHSNLKKWKRMDKADRDEAGPAAPRELNSDIQYLGEEFSDDDDEARNQKQKKKYDELQEKNGGRGKSLMELHKESKGNSTHHKKERKEFDRSKDLRGSMNLSNSSKSMEMLKDSSNLDKRFG